MTLTGRIADLATAAGVQVKARWTALTSLATSMAAIAPMNAHNVGGVLVGKVYDSAVFVTNQGFAPTSTTSGTLVMEPFTSSADLTVYQLGVLVAQAFPAGTKCRVGIYATGTDGWPGELLLDSGVLDPTVGGFRYVQPTVSPVLPQGVPYWLAVGTDTTAGITGQYWGCPIATSAPLAMLTGADTVAQNVVAFPYPSAGVALPNPAPAVSSSTLRSMIFPSVKLVMPS